MSALDSSASGQVLGSDPHQALKAKLDQAAMTVPGSKQLPVELATEVNAYHASAQASLLGKTLVYGVMDFIEQTGPHANISADQGARLHVQLYRNLQNFLNNAPDDFRRCFSLVLRIIASQRKSGVFSARFLFRFVPSMSLANSDRIGLELLFHALTDLSRPESRAAVLKQVDLARAGGAALSADGTQRLIAYFAV